MELIKCRFSNTIIILFLLFINVKYIKGAIKCQVCAYNSATKICVTSNSFLLNYSYQKSLIKYLYPK